MSGEIRVLIVDDDPEDAFLLQRYLQGDPSGTLIRCTTCREPEKALDQLRGGGFDVCFLDYLLGGATGLDLIQKAADEEIDVPLILLTGQGDEEVAASALKAGARDYLTKRDLSRRTASSSLRHVLELAERERREREAQEEVRSAKALVEGTFHALQDLLVVMDREHRIVFSNWKSLEDRYPLWRDDPEMFCYACFFGESAPCDDCPVEMVFRTGEAVSGIEMEMGDRVMEVSVSPILDRQGNVDRVVEHLRDVTERRQAEEKLVESERRYRTLFEHSQDGIAIYQRKSGRHGFKLVDCNQTFVDLSGRSKEDLLRVEDIRLLQMTGGDEPRGGSGTGPLTGTYSWQRPDGRENHVEYSLVPVRLQGRVHYYGIERDVTERILNQRKLQDHQRELEQAVDERTKELGKALFQAELTRDRLDLILRSMGDGLLVLDEMGRVESINSQACGMLERPMEEAVGAPAVDLFGDGGNRARFEAIMDKTASGLPATGELGLPGNGEGAKRHIRSVASPLVEGDIMRGSVVILHDMTRERELDTMKTEFISTAAHELRTPMTNIQGFSELLLMRKDFSPQQQEEFLRLINDSSVVLSKIITDLLDVSRVESGKGLSMRLAKRDLRNVVERKMATYRAQKPEYRFQASIPDERCMAFFDENRVDQILENLLSNAVKYSPDGSNVRLDVRCDGGWRIFSVADEGGGMTEEEKRRIFERFYRGRASTGNVLGSGLGMSIVKHIVDGHGGSIEVESELGRGTTVTVRLPGEPEMAPSEAAGTD
ncbi:ATP-binding protein [Desulfohalovibrio reitneri]|uniref:ATP-binding protein n=1 Tax=Desulfohalovibrio reitneri TaxID=1307759 RepID=UPI0004A6DC4E|nr:ATP-binding protein [Desulfohalovibrio reitneri]